MHAWRNGFMTLSRRLAKAESRLHALANQARNGPPAPFGEARRWLEILEVFLPVLEREGPGDVARQVAGAIALLREYLAANRINAYVEYHAGCMLTIMAGWYHGTHAGAPPFFTHDEEAALRQCVDIGRWRSEANAAAGSGERTLPR